MRQLITVVSIVALAACSSRRTPPPANVPPPVKSIAIVAGDLLASAVGAELYDHGFRSFEVPANQDMTAAGLRGLAVRGVDAVLVVKSVKGNDLSADTASVRLVRTSNGETITNYNWSNSAVRKNLKDAARDVVRMLIETVPAPRRP